MVEVEGGDGGEPDGWEAGELWEEGGGEREGEVGGGGEVEGCAEEWVCVVVAVLVEDEGGEVLNELWVD